MEKEVFSTYVEMILSNGSENMDLKGVLHVCGDDPQVLFLKKA